MSTDHMIKVKLTALVPTSEPGAPKAFGDYCKEKPEFLKGYIESVEVVEAAIGADQPRECPRCKCPRCGNIGGMLPLHPDEPASGDTGAPAEIARRTDAEVKKKLDFYNTSVVHDQYATGWLAALDWYMLGSRGS